MLARDFGGTPTQTCCSQVSGWISFRSQKILTLSSDTDNFKLTRMLETKKVNFLFLLLK